MTTAARREREKEARRNQILDTAERVFFEKGFDHATVDEIAARAEVSKGLVYVYFDTKQELYLALTLRGLELLRAEMEEAATLDGPGLRRFRHTGEAYIRFSERYPGYYHAVSQFGSAEMGRSEPGSYEEACTGELMAILDLVSRLLEAGKADGSVRTDLATRETAITVWSATHGLIQMVAQRGDYMSGHYGLRCGDLHEVFFELVGSALRPEAAELEPLGGLLDAAHPNRDPND